jgi:hypothetical protein
MRVLFLLAVSGLVTGADLKLSSQCQASLSCTEESLSEVTAMWTDDFPEAFPQISQMLDCLSEAIANCLPPIPPIDPAVVKEVAGLLKGVEAKVVDGRVYLGGVDVTEAILVHFDFEGKDALKAFMQPWLDGPSSVVVDKCVLDLGKVARDLLKIKSGDLSVLVLRGLVLAAKSALRDCFSKA